MNTTELIEEHTFQVRRRARLVQEAKNNGEEIDAAQLRSLDRKISVLGQVHNPRISSKSLSSLLVA